jgi:hypothetical protein
MFQWLMVWRERQRRVCVDAKELIRLYGGRAYEEARERAHRIPESLGDRGEYWDCVRREIGRRDFATIARYLT